MTFPVQVGPSTITINRDDRVLVSQPDGRVLGDSDGFFTRDTRFISGYDLFINGQRPTLLGSTPIAFFSSRHEFTNDALVDAVGPVPRQSLGLRLDRTVADGVHEDYDLVNYAPRPVRLTIEIAVLSDFADIFDVKGGQLVRRGELNTRWFRSRRELRTTYVNHDFKRELVVAVENCHVAAAVRQRPPGLRRDDPAQGRVAHLPQVAAGHPFESAARDARLQRGRRAAAQGRRPAPAERQRPDAEPDRRPSLGPGRPRPGGAAPGGPHVRARRLHPGGGRAVVRDPVRARLADRLDAGHLGLPGVRVRARCAASRCSRRPRTTPNATWSRARSRTRSATASWRSSRSCRTSRTTGRTTRRASS